MGAGPRGRAVRGRERVALHRSRSRLLSRSARTWCRSYSHASNWPTANRHTRKNARESQRAPTRTFDDPREFDHGDGDERSQAVIALGGFS